MKKTCLMLMLAMPSLVQAFEALDDAALAQQSGQSGLTLSVNLPNSTLSVSSVGIQDSNGITDSVGGHTHLGGSFASPASLFYAPTTFGATQGVSMCSNLSGACAATGAANPITTLIDAGADATGTQSALVFAISMPSNMRRINVAPFSLYMSPLASGNIFNSSRVLTAGVDKILEVGAGGLDVTFTASPVNISVLFGKGNTGQHMVNFTSGSILRIGNDSTGAAPIKLYSKNASTSSLSLDVDVSATDQVAGFGLTGFYVDLLSGASGAVSFGKVGNTDKLNLTLSNVVAGTSASQAAASFDNLKNASMGNIGLVGVRVTDLTIKAWGVTGF